jgi:hypothetical protein
MRWPGLPSFLLSLIAVAPRTAGVELCGCALELRHPTSFTETRPVNPGGQGQKSRSRAECQGRRANKDQGPAQGDPPMSGRRRGGTLGSWPATCDGKRRGLAWNSTQHGAFTEEEE